MIRRVLDYAGQSRRPEAIMRSGASGAMVVPYACVLVPCLGATLSGVILFLGIASSLFGILVGIGGVAANTRQPGPLLVWASGIALNVAFLAWLAWFLWSL